jgi:hypothetical protein
VEDDFTTFWPIVEVRYTKKQPVLQLITQNVEKKITRPFSTFFRLLLRVCNRFANFAGFGRRWCVR